MYNEVRWNNYAPLIGAEVNNTVFFFLYFMGKTIEQCSLLLWKMQPDAISVSDFDRHISILSETHDPQTTDSLPFDQPPSRFEFLERNTKALAGLFEIDDPLFLIYRCRLPGVWSPIPCYKVGYTTGHIGGSSNSSNWCLSTATWLSVPTRILLARNKPADEYLINP